MIDPSNRFGVWPKNGRVVATNLLTGRILSPEEAINLAAYLVKMATLVGSVTREDFDKLLEEIQ